MTHEEKVPCPNCERLYRPRGLKTHLRFCSPKTETAQAITAGEIITNAKQPEKLDAIKQRNSIRQRLGKVLAFVVIGAVILWISYTLISLVTDDLLIIRPIHWKVLGLLIAIAATIGFSSATFGQKRVRIGSRQWWSRVLQVSIKDLTVELIGAAITFLLLGIAIDAFKESETETIQRTLLVRQLGSKDNRIALAAREQLFGYGWLGDGTLRDALLIEANLKGLDLLQADMQGAFFNWANLEGADLMYANLEEANFFAANACSTNFAYSNLQKAILQGTNLRGANFQSADLRGASFFQSHLEGALFMWNAIDESTILPDGRHWSREIDLREYTGPKQHWSKEYDPSVCTDQDEED